MDWQLDAVEARVLGSLLEKESTTPDYYPLSLNALVNACNQRSNREPVVAYDEDTVESALERLRAKGLALRITGGDSRVPKHAQRFTEKFNLGRREAALICVLMLRGPQTVGELRGRTERLYSFEDLEGVEATLDRLAEMEWVKKLPRHCRVSRSSAGRTCWPAMWRLRPSRGGVIGGFRADGRSRRCRSRTDRCPGERNGRPAPRVRGVPPQLRMTRISLAYGQIKGQDRKRPQTAGFRVSCGTCVYLRHCCFCYPSAPSSPPPPAAGEDERLTFPRT